MDGITNFHIDWRGYESLEFCRRMEITFCLSCSTNIKSVDWKYLSSFVKLFGKSKMIMMIIRDRGYFDSNPLNSSIYLSLSAIILLTSSNSGEGLFDWLKLCSNAL